MWSGKKAHMHFVVKGRGLALEKIERAIALSVELGIGNDRQDGYDHPRL
jgi:hypothetical protein